MKRALASGASAIVASAAVAATAQPALAQHASGEHDVGAVEIGFCTDMTAHHVQALEMCERVLGRDTGDAVQSAATEVLRNQAIEVGMMRAWLADWGASTAPPLMVMGWMSTMHSASHADDTTTDHVDVMHDMTDGMPLADMPGYATPAQLLALSRSTPGVAKGRMWLELMRAHHVGGVSMADAAAELATSEKVLRLAETQSAVQAWEIEQYDYLLSTTYA